MSRWAWHEKHGVVKGAIRRASDYMTPEQQESAIQAQHRREMDWIAHHPEGEHLFRDKRTCAYCGVEGRQEDMRWTGRRWLCDKDYADMLSGNIERIP